jgi:hypothetical protein
MPPLEHAPRLADKGAIGISCASSSCRGTCSRVKFASRVYFDCNWRDESRVLASRAASVAFRSKGAKYMSSPESPVRALVFGMLWMSAGGISTFESSDSLALLPLFSRISLATAGFLWVD